MCDRASTASSTTAVCGNPWCHTPAHNGRVFERRPTPGPTERLAFREMGPDDLDLMCTLLGDPEVMWVYPEPFSRARVRAWIDWNVRGYRERGFGLWILQDLESGGFVG